MAMEMSVQRAMDDPNQRTSASFGRFDPRHFNELIGHEQVVEALKRLIRRGGIDMPLLLVGPTGSAKAALGRAYARAVNCARTTDLEFGGHASCSCDACQATNSSGMSYVQIDLAAAKSTLYRYLRRPIGLPFDGAQRCFVFLTNVDRSLRGTDHLLKWLERRTTYVPILAAEHIQSLPETIVSRCAVFHLNPLSRAKTEELCRRMLRIARLSVDEKNVPWIASLCDGNAGRLEGLVEYLDQLSNGERGDLRKSARPAHWLLNFADYFEQRLCGEEPVVHALSDFHTLAHARRFVVAMFGDPARTLTTSVFSAAGPEECDLMETLQNKVKAQTLNRDWAEVCRRMRLVASDDYSSDAWGLLDEIAREVRAISQTKRSVAQLAPPT
jgi:hypothetical protein